MLATVSVSFKGRTSDYKLLIAYLFLKAIARPRATERLIAGWESFSRLFNHA
jgi:hypothetical protein